MKENQLCIIYMNKQAINKSRDKASIYSHETPSPSGVRVNTLVWSGFGRDPSAGLSRDNLPLCFFLLGSLSIKEEEEEKVD